MSTRLTSSGVAMVDSYGLQLVMTGGKVQDLAGHYLCTALTSKGYRSITPNILHFLSALECGINYGSEIARSLGVSRQMVAKTVKDLCVKGYLEQIDGVGKQKQIVFTMQGELLMADARLLLAELDKKLTKEIGSEGLVQVLKGLGAIQALLSSAE